MSKKGPHLFVTGASGLLGANFVALASSQFRVTACYWRHSFIWPGVAGIPVDLREEPKALRVLDDNKPLIIVHFAAATNVDRCETHPNEAWELNVRVTERLAHWAADNNRRFVLMSTDSVFDGTRGSYTTKDVPSPVNQYAASKFESENVVRAIVQDHLIVRANIYGWNAQRKNSLAEWVLGRLESGEMVPGFSDVIITPLLVNTLAQIILTLIKKGVRGTVHAASRDSVSKYDFAGLIADVFGLARQLVLPTMLASTAMIAPRPLNTTLIADQLEREFGVSLPSVREDLLSFKALRDSGYTVRLKAAARIHND